MKARRREERVGVGAPPTVKMGFLITGVSLCVLAITVLYLAPVLSFPPPPFSETETQTEYISLNPPTFFSA